MVTSSHLTLRALLDLVLPVACAGCGADATAWCPRCAALLQGPARPARPHPCPPGLPPTWAVSGYAGPVRAAVVAHKERGARALGRPLGAALALSVASAVPGDGRVLLVPAPSRASAVRARGEDPTVRLARVAAATLRRAGRQVTVAPVLRVARGTRDQAGLGVAERAANLGGAVRVAPGRWSAVSALEVVVVDDVVTTGATLAESARAARAAGAVVVAAAVVAATARRGVGVSAASRRD